MSEYVESSSSSSSSNDEKEDNAEDSDKEDHKEKAKEKNDAKDSQFVHIVVLQKKPETSYESKLLFADPFVLSVRRNITYRELYKTVILRLSGGAEEGEAGYFKEVPPLDIKLTTGKQTPPSASQTRFGRRRPRFQC
jgi:hypothetical protein